MGQVLHGSAALTATVLRRDFNYRGVHGHEIHGPRVSWFAPHYTGHFLLV